MACAMRSIHACVGCRVTGMGPSRNLTLNPSPQAERDFQVPRPTLLSIVWRGVGGEACLALLLLCLASVACWSNDTLFIPPTETPTPTPIPPTPNVEGKFKIG